jgi:uncharacterized protein involved in exopolysaccharide biosynthesis
MSTGARTEFSLNDYLRVIFKRQGLIILLFLIVTLGIGTAIYLQPNVYEVSGKLLIRRARIEPLLTPADTRTLNSLPTLPQAQDMPAEVELLKSRSLIEAAVRKLGFLKQAQARQREPSVMLAGLVQLPASLTAWLPSWLPPRLGSESDGNGVTWQEDSTAVQLEAAIARIQKGLTVQAIPNSNLIDVRLRFGDAKRGAEIVNTILTLYLDRYLQIRRTPGVTEFFATNRNLLEAHLRDAVQALRAFEDKVGVPNANVQMEAYSRQLAEAEHKLLKSRYDVLDKEVKLAMNKAALAATPEYLVTRRVSARNPLLEAMQLRLLDLEAEHGKVRQIYAAQDRRVREVEERIAALKQRMSTEGEWMSREEDLEFNPSRRRLEEAIQETQTSLARLKIDQQESEDMVQETRQRVREIARHAVDKEQLVREVKANEDAYLLYRRKAEEARISEAMDQEKMVNISIADTAYPTPKPLNTRKDLSYLFAVAVGLVAGVGGVFCREFFDQSIKSAEAVESHLSLPVVASIPEEQPNGKNGKNGKHGRKDQANGEAG